jgi:hypothetical protein
MTDIEKLLAGRKIIDDYRAASIQRRDESAELPGRLQAIGFASITDFYNFNDTMCLEAIKNLPIFGNCDLCKGYKGMPECQKRFKDQLCATLQPLSGDQLFKAILYRIQKRDFRTDSWTDTLIRFKAQSKSGKFWICPEGHGFYLKPNEIVDPGFVLWWI